MQEVAVDVNDRGANFRLFKIGCHLHCEIYAVLTI